jgi:large repetitive protein
VIYQLNVPTMQTLHIDLNTNYDTVHYLLAPSCTGAPIACSDPTTMTINGLAAGHYFVGVDGYFTTSSGTFTMNVYGTIAPNGRCDGALAQAGAFTCSNGLTCQGATGNKRCSSQCSDGVDNNGDGKIDYPDDPGCSSPSDNSESTVCPGASCPVCADGVDNDGDTAKDYPADFGCSSAGGTSEVFCAGEPDFGGRIQLPQTSGTLAGKAANYQQSCQSNTGADMAYSLALPVPVASLTIDTEGSTITDTVLSLKDANCGMEFGCDDDGGTGFLSSLTVANVPKGNYAILVDGFGSSNAGAFKLNVHGIVAPQTACTNALFTSGVLACPSGTTCTAGKCQ